MSRRPAIHEYILTVHVLVIGKFHTNLYGHEYEIAEIVDSCDNSRILCPVLRFRLKRWATGILHARMQGRSGVCTT